MKDPEVLFEKLILEGFGPYRERKEFIFCKGTNIYVALNETGKSTMIAGLAAVIFGLSHRQKSTSAFTIERFRNWNSPSACRGELHLRSGGDSYIIIRDFDSHQVSLWIKEKSSNDKNLIVEGLHNPEARKPLVIYEDKIKDLVGINNRELFMEAFFLSQPIPEAGGIGDELQGLLSGSKGSTFSSVLEKLSDSLKRMTKFLGPNHRGILVKNSSKNGSLEIIQDQINSLMTGISRGKDSADSVPELQQSLQELGDKIKKKRKDKELGDQVALAWSEWNTLKNQYAVIAKQRDQILEDGNKIKETISVRDQLQNSLIQEYPEFVGFYEDREGTFEKHAYEYSNYENRILDSGKQIEAHRASIDKYITEIGEINSALSHRPEMARLGEDPEEKIKGLKLIADQYKKTWERLLIEVKSLDDQLSRLHGDYGLIEDASEYELDNLKNWRNKASELSLAKDQAKMAFDDGSQKIDAVGGEESKYQDSYRDVLNLPEQACAAVLKKCSLLKEIEQLQSQTKVNVSPAIPWSAYAAGIGLLALLSFTIIGTDNLAGLLSGFALSIVIGVISTKILYPKLNPSKGVEGRDAQAAIRNLENEINGLNAYLGPFGEADYETLIRLGEKIKQRDEAFTHLQSRQDQIKDIDIENLREKLNRAIESEDLIYRDMKRFVEQYTNIPEAYDEWRALKNAIESSRSNTNRISLDNFGCAYERVHDVLLTDAGVAVQLQELGRFMNSLLNKEGIEISSVDGLMNGAMELRDEWWSVQLANAVEYMASKRNLIDLNFKKEDRERLLHEEISKLKDYQEEQLESKRFLHEVLAVNRNDIKSVIIRFNESKSRYGKINTYNIEMEAIFKKHNANGLEDLTSRMKSLEVQASARMLQWQKHIDSYPGLPSPDMANDMNYIQRKQEESKACAEGLKNEIEQLNEEYANENKRLGRLEGGTSIDIAAAELELGELLQRKEEIEFQTDALSVAYKELQGAIIEFGQSYQARLEAKATEYCREILQASTRRIALDKEFNIGITEDGRPISLDRLSKGARDQVYLSLRFAVADILAEDVKLPIILDDPFTSTDAERLDQLKRILNQVAADRQVFLMAHGDQYKGWGTAIAVG